MKNYEQVTNDLIERRDKYVMEQKKRKRVLRIVTSLCCVCIIAFIGIGTWQDGWFNAVNSNESIISDEKDNLSSHKVDDNANKDRTQQNDQTSSKETVLSPGVDNGVADILGVVEIDGITYIQFHFSDENAEKLFTVDTCLGDAGHFEGTYKNYSDTNNISATLYTVKESQNVLLVKLGNGGTVVLCRDGDLVVNGNTYFASEIDTNSFVQDKCLGIAEKFEIISIPHCKTVIHPKDEVWTVKNDDTKLLIKKADGGMIVLCIREY